MKTNKLTILVTVIFVTIISLSSVSAAVGNPDSGDGIQDGRNVNAPAVKSGEQKANNKILLNEKNKRIKTKLTSRYTGKVDGHMNAFNNKYKNMSGEKLRVKYDDLDKKIDAALKRIENSNISDDKKELYRNLFTYIKIKIGEKLLETE